MQTGQIITKLRTEAGLSQARLAEMLFVSRELVSKWETGKRLPDYKMIEELAAMFSVSANTLLAKDAVLLSELAALAPKGFEPDGEALKRELNRFLDTLNRRDRSVFIRRYYFLETPDEIGEAYGIKPNYVRTILTRTRRKLKRYLKEGAK